MTSLKDLEEQVDDLRRRLQTANAIVQELHADKLAALESGTTTPTPGPTLTDPGEGDQAAAQPVARVYETVDAWVDEVFIILAARKQYAWCSRWREHPEARARLIEVWRAWEFGNTKADTDLQAMENWLRLVFDYHAGVLLDRAGPFADCTSGHSERHRPGPLARSDYTASDPSAADIDAAIQARFGSTQDRTVNLTEPIGGDR